jgi:hypothetical protein
MKKHTNPITSFGLKKIEERIHYLKKVKKVGKTPM